MDTINSLSSGAALVYYLLAKVLLALVAAAVAVIA